MKDPSQVMPQHCPVRERPINGNTGGTAHATSSALEDHFCSRYCRIFREDGLSLTNGKEKYGIAQYDGFNWWPKIPLNCDTCGKKFNLTNQCDHNNQVFCSTTCSIAVKTCKRRAMKDYQILRILRTVGWENGPHLHGGKGWMHSQEVAKRLSLFNYKGTSGSVAGIFKRWVARGIVERKACEYPLTGSAYRLAPKYRKAQLGALVIEYQGRKPQSR